MANENNQQPQHNNALDGIIAQRYAEVQELQNQGITPYPNRCEKQISCAEAKAAEEGAEAVTAGRLVQLRLMGKAAFAHLRDFSGRVQLYIAKDQLGEEPYAFFKKHIAVGDFVSVVGHVFVTKTGEKTIKASKLTLLSKAIRPMPEKYHGLQDTEVRFRKRHLDLIANEDVKDIFVKRAKIISSIYDAIDGTLTVSTAVPIDGNLKSAFTLEGPDG
ncbi:MAG: hypothetical protein IKA93_04165, partial [Elusimicrobiaceae bacterium]|nr:hypothetical protein [Elusimicrobiaceae bacterium]